MFLGYTISTNCIIDWNLLKLNYNLIKWLLALDKLKQGEINVPMDDWYGKIYSEYQKN